MSTTYPEPTDAARRAWYFEKRDRRRIAAYRNSLPQGIQVLTAMLADAPSPWHAGIIEARIEHVRTENRRKTRKRRAREAATRTAAETEQEARINV